MYDQHGNCNFKEAVDSLTTKRWIQYYEAEEQRLLQEIGSIISSEMMATRSSCCSSAKDTLWSSSSPFSTGSMQPNDEEKNTTGSTLLSSMCHLVNLVVHLRRQNKHLRKQVVCLDEMCKMQCLQSELLETARACVHASQSRYFLNSLDDDSGGEEASSNCSQVEGGDGTTQLFSLQPSRWVEAVDSTSPSSSSSPPPLPVAGVAIGRDQEQNKSTLDEENNHPLEERRLSMEPAVVRKDSDEPVFSEVQLPNYSSTTSKKGTIQLNAVRHSYLSSASSAHCYTPVSLPDTSTSGRVSRILERLGIRKGLLKRPALSTSLATVDSAETKRHTVGPVRHVRLLSARKAFLKKRKRKISESDSWASSEAAAAGKIYSLLEFPEKFDRNALVKIGANRMTASSMEKKQPALAMDSERYDDAAEVEKKINDDADSLRQTFGSSASESQLNPADIDKRSSVLSVHSDCRDAQRLRPVAGTTAWGQSMSPSQMTVSNDSVFTSHDTDQDGAYFSGVNVLKQLLALQEKNCILICQLRDKTKEYENIVDRVAGLEESMRLLRNRLKFNNFLDTVHRKSTEKCFVPAAAAKNIEQQFKTLEQSIKEMKANCYRVQQTVLEAENKQHLINQRYLEKIENLQAANRDLARPLTSPAFPEQWEHRHRIEQSERKYQTLYKFTVKLMQRVHRMRKALVETDCAYCNCSAELLQTQSSLLLAHAQIERQKAELNFCKASSSSGKTRIELRRVQSYHGQDLLARTIDPELSFYLPFKVYGRQLAKTESESDISLRIPDDTLEAEFLALINPSQRKAVPPKMESYSKASSQQVINRRSNESRAKQLHRSEGKMLNRQATKKDHRSPSLQRLTKIGHVKQLAATFDSNRLDAKCDSTSVLPHYSYGLYYGQHQAVKQSSQRAVMEKHYDSISTMDRSDAATSSEQFDSSLTDSYRETEYETMIYQMSIRPVPLNVVPMTQQSHHQTIAQPSPSMLPRIAGPPMPRSYVVSAHNVRPLFCSVRPSSIPQRAAATAVIRNRVPSYENASAGQQVSRSSWLQKLRRKM